MYLESITCTMEHHQERHERALLPRTECPCKIDKKNTYQGVMGCGMD